MQPSESLEVYRAAVELRERLMVMPLRDMREAAEILIAVDYGRRIETVARHLVALINTIQDRQ